MKVLFPLACGITMIGLAIAADKPYNALFLIASFYFLNKSIENNPKL